MKQPEPEQVYEAVREHYGRLAEQESLTELAADCGCAESDCCTGAEALYEVELTELPPEVSQLSLGCGDPITLASLRPGERVLDLGSGGGIDCFLAAQRVGPTGWVIGVDMTPSMIAKAERNQAKIGLTNVEFRLGQIEDLPVKSDDVDVVISNCVINLSPDKASVFREAYRVLRPGGRLAVSDVVTQGHFGEEARADMAAWAACISGAEDVADYVALIRAAGFTQISVGDQNNPELELVSSLALYIGQPRVFSARVMAIKPGA